MRGAVGFDPTGQWSSCSPGPKLTTDDVVRDVRNSETSTHREELVEATGATAPASAKRWGPSQEGSAPTVGGVVGEVPAGWAARVSLLQRSVSQGRQSGLSEVLLL